MASPTTFKMAEKPFDDPLCRRIQAEETNYTILLRIENTERPKL